MIIIRTFLILLGCLYLLIYIIPYINIPNNIKKIEDERYNNILLILKEYKYFGYLNDCLLIVFFISVIIYVTLILGLRLEFINENIINYMWIILHLKIIIEWLWIYFIVMTIYVYIFIVKKKLK